MYAYYLYIVPRIIIIWIFCTPSRLRTTDRRPLFTARTDENIEEKKNKKGGGFSTIIKTKKKKKKKSRNGAGTKEIFMALKSPSRARGERKKGMAENMEARPRRST